MSFRVADGVWLGARIIAANGADRTVDLYLRGQIVIPASTITSATDPTGRGALSANVGEPIAVKLSEDGSQLLALAASQWPGRVTPPAGVPGHYGVIPNKLIGLSDTYDD